MEPKKKKHKNDNNYRFVLYSEEELQQKHDASKNKNTIKSEARANTAFQKFLLQAGKTNLEYWFYEESELDKMLEQFWFGARKYNDSDQDSDPEDMEKEDLLYFANTMKNFRYALNRILKNKGHLYDIINTSNLSLRKSQKAFEASQKMLKEKGKGQIYSAPEITEADRVKLYNHPLLNPNNGPEALQRKVQFDLRLYFCRRGMENIEKMKKDDFQIKYNSEHEEWIVVKVKDELTKNHRDLENIVSGVMPENKTDPMCPVQSFRTYIEHLNPENNFMWQKALEKIDPERPNVWYSKKHIGKNPLSTFMSQLSKDAKLSQIYTNHSIRSTGITVLTNNKFSNADIMSVSGHKSVQSLAIYQKTDESKKVEMGKALSGSLTPQQIQRKLPKLDKPPLPQGPSAMQLSLPSEKAVSIKENVNDAIVPFEPNFDEDDGIADFDLLSAICDMEDAQEEQKENKMSTTSNVANTCTSNVVNQIPKSFFTNSKIGTINVNFINK